VSTASHPPIGLVVSDVDGTLVDKNKKLTDATIAAVGRLRAAGVRFTVISARPMSGVRPLLEPLGLDEDVGAFNGGIVFRRDGTIVSHDMIDADVARGVIDLAAGEQVDTWVFADDQWFATNGDGPPVRRARGQDHFRQRRRGPAARALRTGARPI
jgi:HAD superfamily hydrolase (TIGR01484 family)